MPVINPNLLTALGCTAATFGTAVGSAVATAHASVYTIRLEVSWRALFPLIQTGFVGLFGLITSYLLSSELANDSVTTTQGIKYLTAGLLVGLAGLASGCGMAVFLRQVNANTGTVLEAKTLGDEDTPAMRVPLLSGSGTTAFDCGDSRLVRVVISLAFLKLIAWYGLILAFFLILFC